MLTKKFWNLLDLEFKMLLSFGFCFVLYVVDLRDHSLSMAGGGLVRMKGRGGSPKIIGSLKGNIENMPIGVWGGPQLFNNWFIIKIKANINFIIKTLIPITVTISRERLICSVPADHTAGRKFGFFFGGGGGHELFVFITRGQEFSIWFMIDITNPPPAINNEWSLTDIFVGLHFKNYMYIETFKKQFLYKSFYYKHFVCFINEEFPTLEMKKVRWSKTLGPFIYGRK